MDLQPEDGLEEAGLSSTLFRIVQNNKMEQLRLEIGSLSHRCRNVLGGMKMSLYLMKREAADSLPPWWDQIERNYQGIERLFDDLQAIYRPMPLTSVRAPFRSLVRSREACWREWFSSGQGNLDISPPAQESSCEFDPMSLRMGCDTFLRWRADMLRPGQTGRLSWRTAGGRLHACWQEVRSGRSTPEPRQRDHVTGINSAPAGCQMLALPLFARVIKAHHGTIQWDRAPDFQVMFGWPLAQPVDMAHTGP